MAIFEWSPKACPKACGTRSVIDVQDGYDTQEWIGHQSWCNGSIGTAGGSYVGWTQWAPAPKASRYLNV